MALSKRFTFLMLLVVALALAFAGRAQADLQVVDECPTLYAGQSIDAGTVCVTVDGEALVVTYTTTDGWELTGAHLWVGNDQADMPQTKKGNSKVGNFPYNSGDITGRTSYAFTIPLTELNGVDCGETFLAAAHAALRKDNGSGAYQTETGWADGTRMVDKGNWATYFEFTFSCDDPPDPAVKCETAFAFGGTQLWDINDASGDPITNRWGWEIEFDPETEFLLSRPIYAGAGQNDPSKGTCVGELLFSYDDEGDKLTVTYHMHDYFTLDETHLYVGTTEIQTGAPGQFGYSHDLSDASSDTHNITISGETIYIVAHAVVCGPFE